MAAACKNMNKNYVIIGGAFLIVGGAIATGIALSNPEKSTSNERADKNIAQDMLEQDFKDFEDEENYSFCQGREEIKGVYENSVFGNEKGDVKYISDDISVFDKKRNKLYILGRRIEYQYLGDGKMQIADGEGTMNFEENGVVTEYFGMNSAPVRIDYNSKIINPAPERKSTDWVVVKIKSIGSLMGITDEREDVTSGDAKVFCSVFSLGDAFISPDYISFEKACPDNSPNPGVKFSGNFKFECGAVDNERGIEIAKEYQEKEQLEKEFDAISDEENDEIGNDFEGVIKESQSDDLDMQRKLQEMRAEMKNSGMAN